MANTWLRIGEMPQILRLSIVVDSVKHPELAEWIWNLPKGKSSDALRKALELGMAEIELIDSAPRPSIVRKERQPLIPVAKPINPAHEPVKTKVNQPMEAPPPFHKPLVPEKQRTTVVSEPNISEVPALDAEKLAAMRQLISMLDN